MIPENTRVMNEALAAELNSHDPRQIKNAADNLTDFVRTEVREKSICNRILAPEPVSDTDLTVLPDTEKLVQVIEVQPDSPGTVTIPFDTSAPEWKLSGRRAVVTFARVATLRVRKDVALLATYRYDIRQVISDQMVKDMHAHLDAKFLAAVNASLGGADTAAPTTGVVQWETIFGGIGRDEIHEAKKLIPRSTSHLSAAICLINNVTIEEINKNDRYAWGGDIAEKIMLEGWAQDRLAGMDVIITIKRHLVPDNSMYLFGDPRFIGKNCVYQDTTMHIDNKEWEISFRLSKICGGVIVHAGALGRADFA